MTRSDNLLLELGVPFRRGPDGLLVEAQALNGLRLWTKHFGHVTVCAPELPVASHDDSSIVWADPRALIETGRLTLVPLPWGYHPKAHFKLSSQVKRRLEPLVASHRYLCFSNLGAFGTWGNLAAAAARRQKKPYSLWFDWVLHEMGGGGHGSLKRRMWSALVREVVKFETYRGVRACALGLFHGKTVFDAYAPLCRNPQLVHDVHVHPEDAIGETQLSEKIIAQRARGRIRIGYVGRVHPMKAPLQWIESLRRAAEVVGADKIEAQWLGDGPLLEEARSRVRELGLEGSIAFRGFVADRDEILGFLRQQDLLMFCHVTPESPRCLLEAIISGTPLVGYESEYAKDLTGEGGSILTPIGDTNALANSIVRLLGDPDSLSALIGAAAQSRFLYSDEAVFQHRSELIKRYA